MKSKTLLYSVTVLLTVAASLSLAAAADSFSPAKPQLATRDDEPMRRWRANRFGLFIHWGLYAVAGGEWKGKEIPSAAEWIQSSGKIRAEEYAGLVREFNPTNYDPVAWARMAREMGVRYVTITTKHHEGFCLWDSEFTDFDIAATPYGLEPTFVSPAAIWITWAAIVSTYPARSVRTG